jgi:hypothetical protein
MPEEPQIDKPDTGKPAHWKRLVTEGLVIMVSILLAFAIDAWWDDQQEKRSAEGQVARVVAELQANVFLLQGQAEALEESTRATREFLLLMAPEPEPVSESKVASLVERMYSVGTISLNHSAADAFLSTGQLTDGPWVQIRLDLADLLSDVQSSESSSLELRQMRPDMITRLQTYISGLNNARGHPLMSDYAPSKFPSDTAALLSDMQFEGAIANYAIRAEINLRNVQRLLDKHQKLKAQIEQ